MQHYNICMRHYCICEILSVSSDLREIRPPSLPCGLIWHFVIIYSTMNMLCTSYPAEKNLKICLNVKVLGKTFINQNLGYDVK